MGHTDERNDRCQPPLRPIADLSGDYARDDWQRDLGGDHARDEYRDGLGGDYARDYAGAAPERGETTSARATPPLTAAKLLVRSPC